MSIPVILQGDTSAEVSLIVTPGEYAGCVLDVTFHGIVREFSAFNGGDTISVSYSADETKGFPLGTGMMTMIVRKGEKVRSLPFAKVKVTDSPSEVYNESISISPSVMDIDELTAADSQGNVKRAVNAIINALKRSALAISVMLCLSAFGELTPNTILDDVPGNTTLSNIVASAGVTIGTGEVGTDGAAVTNIVNGIVGGKFVPLQVTEDTTVSLVNDDEDGLKLTFGSFNDNILTIDGGYDDGAVFFGGDVYFTQDSKTTFKSGAIIDFISDVTFKGVTEFFATKDKSTLKVATRPGFGGVLPPDSMPTKSAIFGNGILYRPSVLLAHEEAEYLLEFPAKTGIIATVADVTSAVSNAVDNVSASSVNLTDPTLNRKWELSADNGKFTFTLVEEAE